MEEIVTAAVDYSLLDRDDNKVRVRLNSTVIDVANVNDSQVETTYVLGGDAYTTNEDMPLVVPAVSGVLANDSDVETFGVKATFVTSAKVPDKVVYAIVKEVFENFEDFKKLHPAYSGLTKKNMLEGLSAPLHPGAVKYYKEAGLM